MHVSPSLPVLSDRGSPVTDRAIIDVIDHAINHVIDHVIATDC
ncbi:hypothetical protein [Streptomyces sp. NPDC058268]